MALRILLAISLLLAACGGSRKPGPGAPGDEGSGAPELDVLDRFKTLDDYVEQSRGQCDRLATSLATWLDTNADEVGALIERSRAEPSLDGEQLARVEDNLQRIFERLLDAIGTCRGQGGVNAVHARLDAWLEED